jgi:GT2 family glycosyltransferase
VSPSPEETQPAVSVIVLNWNGAAFLPRCLEALQAQTYRDFEVLVVDNGSSDGSVDDIEARWPGFRLLRLEKNLGFAVANNRAAEMVHGRWLVFLNNDAFPNPDWLEQMVDAALAWPAFSFFASRLVYADDLNRIQATGDVLNISGFAWSRDNGIPVDYAHLQLEEVFSPCAAAAMYQRQAFLEVGGFNPDFVSHLEDIDLGFRLRLSGRRCLYVPAAIAAHVVSASYGAVSEYTVYQVQRNVVWMFVANMPGWLFWKYLPAHLMGNLIFLLYYFRRGRARAVWRAKLDALRGLPAALRRRRVIQNTLKVPVSEIDQVLDHGWFSPYLLGRRSRRLKRVAPQPASMEPRGR